MLFIFKSRKDVFLQVTENPSLGEERVWKGIYHGKFSKQTWLLV